MFAPIEPFKTGYLPLTHGHTMYFELSGNSKGMPAIFLHGGPGGGGIKGFRKMFDPEKYLIIYFDQRGCGKSTPSISEKPDLENNNTQILISDIEQLRTHLAIDQWIVSGGSWGTTLALAYAQAYPEKVMGILVSSITTTSKEEVKWITEDIGNLFPKQWDEFANAVSSFNGERLIDRYYSAITHESSDIRKKAALDWCKWEDIHVSLDPQWKPMFNPANTTFDVLQFATLVIHYWKHSGFLDKNPILKNMSKLKSIPGYMFHGRLDVSSPLRTAWDLQKAWPNSQLTVIEDEGHGGPKMSEAMCKALSEIYERVK